MLGHKALGGRLKTYFVENGLMRKDEARNIVALFEKQSAKVEVVDARKQFFKASKGINDPEQKREAIAQTFYKDVFGALVKKSNSNLQSR